MDKDRKLRFGANVRKLRQARGMSIEGLAEAAGVHFTALSSIERGESDPRLHTIASLGEALEADVPELLAGV
jgi:transcriptional regulator with XRE-family HTH domain